MLKHLYLIALALMATVVWAKAGSTEDVDTVLARFREAKGIQAKVTKTVVQELMGTNHTSEGDFYFAKGKLRLDIQKPERSTLVYDGKHVWFESRLDEQTVQVTKMRSGELKKSDSLLAALFDRKDVLKNFKLIEQKDKDGAKVFVFEPKDKKRTEVQLLELTLKGKDLERILYKDQVENQVSFAFQNLKRGTVPVSKFTYKPPKGASITEI